MKCPKCESSDVECYNGILHPYNCRCKNCGEVFSVKMIEDENEDKNNKRRL